MVNLFALPLAGIPGAIKRRLLAGVGSGLLVCNQCSLDLIPKFLERHTAAIARLATQEFSSLAARDLAESIQIDACRRV